MLQRQVKDGVVFYASDRLAERRLPHAFSTRRGGVSAGAFASLNLGNPNGQPVQDPWANIEENYRRLFAAAGAPDRQWCRVHQVHGDRCLTVETGAEFDFAQKADALVTQDPSRLVTVRVADCVPVLLASADGRTVAAVHAGWRGVVAGVVTSAVQTLLATSGDRSANCLAAAVGPCISFDAFEVGPEVLEEFTRAFAADAPIRRCADGKGRVDLREALRRQLVALGVPDGQIDVSDRCTYRDADEFFSHRRDRGLTGRMAAVIGVRP